MQRSELPKLVVAIVVLAVAGLLLWRFLGADSGVSERAFFYDLSRQKLFTGPRTAVPPIKGTDDDKEDAVRAVVISTNGNPADKKSWTIAYLEMYAPDLKKQMEEAQATGGSPRMGRALAQTQRLVRRLHDTQWFALSTAEGERIVTEWATPGASGITPVVCTP
jgi:hypothetical protein